MHLPTHPHTPRLRCPALPAAITHCLPPPLTASLTPPACTARFPQDTAPWWSEITLTQVVIILSFTTIIALMIATFFVVVKVGAVRFNE